MRIRHGNSHVKISWPEIRDKVEVIFSYRLWKLKVIRAILKCDKNVASIATTGSGKTLAFWMPLLFIENGIQIVITPLNILDNQNVESLAKAGISAVCIMAEPATEENFQVCGLSIGDSDGDTQAHIS